MSEQLLCGAAREVITPPAEMIDHLSGLMNSSFGGVVDDLYKGDCLGIRRQKNASGFL